MGPRVAHIVVLVVILSNFQLLQTAHAQDPNRAVPQMDGSPSSLTPVRLSETMENNNTSSRWENSLGAIDSLFRLMSTGEIDPFSAIPKLADKGDTIVPMLKTILTNLESQETPRRIQELPADTGRIQYVLVNSVQPVHVTWCLRVIGTKSAKDELVSLAANSKNMDARISAIEFIAKDLVASGSQDTVGPDPLFINLFLAGFDIDQNSPAFGRSISEVSRDAFQRWTGEMDLANLNTQASRERWWKSNAKNLIWDADRGRFQLKVQ